MASERAKKRRTCEPSGEPNFHGLLPPSLQREAKKKRSLIVRTIEKLSLIIFKVKCGLKSASSSNARRVARQRQITDQIGVRIISSIWPAERRAMRRDGGERAKAAAAAHIDRRAAAAD